MKIKLMGSWVIYYKLLCGSLFFSLNCIVEELCEGGLRATFQGNKEEKKSIVSSAHWHLFRRFAWRWWDCLLWILEKRVAVAPRHRMVQTYVGTVRKWKNTNQLQDESS